MAAVPTMAPMGSDYFSQAEIINTLRTNSFVINLMIGILVPLFMSFGRNVANSLYLHITNYISNMFTKIHHQVPWTPVERIISDTEPLFPFNCNATLQVAILSYIHEKLNMDTSTVVANISMLPELGDMFSADKTISYERTKPQITIPINKFIKLSFVSTNGDTLELRITTEESQIDSKLGPVKRTGSLATAEECVSASRGITKYILRAQSADVIDEFIAAVVAYSKEQLAKAKTKRRLYTIHPPAEEARRSDPTRYPIREFPKESVEHFDGFFCENKTGIIDQLKNFRDGTGKYKVLTTPDKLIIFIQGGYGVGKTMLCEFIARFMDRNLVYVPPMSRRTSFLRLMTGQYEIPDPAGYYSTSLGYNVKRLTTTENIFVFEELNDTNPFYRLIKPREQQEVERLSKKNLPDDSVVLRVSSRDQDDITLDDFLNLLDGCHTNESLMAIFITNKNCSDFDRAMLRPGRIDLNIHLSDNISESIACQLVVYHFTSVRGMDLSSNEHMAIYRVLQKTKESGMTLTPCSIASITGMMPTLEDWLDRFENEMAKFSKVD